MKKLYFIDITGILNKKISLIARLKPFFIFVSALLLISATNQNPKPVIWVLGDSTACNVPKSKSKPPHYLMGWAQMLQTFFHIDSVEVQNKAQPGRSSKSFSKDIWPSFKNKIKEGDFLIIQFGHNDSKKEEYRKTDPQTTYKEYLSLYIDHSRKVGATPILTTSIVRSRFIYGAEAGTDAWEADGKTMLPTHGDYPEAMRELAKEKNVALVDLTSLTKEHFEKMGKDSTNKTVYFPGDGSHLQKKGAVIISRLFVNSIVSQKLIPLCSWVKESPCSPTSNKILISNQTDTYRDFISYNSAQRVLCLNTLNLQGFSVTIFTLRGKSIFSKTFNQQSTNVKMNIPIHELSIGTFIVKSESNGTSSTKLINVMY